jgi:hypothetical protein
MEHEVLAEAGNIILNAFLGTIANVLDQTLRMSLPSVIRGNGATLFEDRNVGDLVLVLYIDFIAKDRNIRGFTVLLMDLPAIADLKAIVHDFTKRDRGTVWKVLGQTYYLKEVCDTSFAFEVVGVDLNATISRQIRE